MSKRWMMPWTAASRTAGSIRQKRWTAAFLAVLLLAQGCCSWDDKEKGAATGGLIGAGGGAIIGAMTGSWFWGALIGAGTGALAGYVIADQNQMHHAKASAPSGRPGDSVRAEQADREFQMAMSARDSASAEYHLKKSLELHPTPAAHNNLGLVELQAGHRQAARASFREAIALDPHYEPARQNLEKMGA